MGRGTIAGESGEGLYSLSLDYGSADIQAKIDGWNARIAQLDSEITQLEGDLLSERAAIRSLWVAVDNTIAVYAADPTEENLSTVNERTIAALKGSQQEQAIKKSLAERRFERGNLSSKVSQYSAEVVTETRSAWCADLTESATGEVATIEVNGEGPGILIAPGARAPTASDGAFTDRLAMSASAAYLNAALLPGWQRHQPTYRTGQLTGIDRSANTGTVNIGSSTSTAQSLPINAASSVTGPFEYMTCNHAAFTVGDDVVVQFEGQSWDSPKIIGFTSNPKACGPRRVIVPLELLSSATVPYYPTNKVAASLMSADVTWSLCSTGKVIVLDSGVPRPPGYNYAGQANNAFSNVVTLRPHHSELGVYASEQDRGGFTSFAFDDAYRISGSASNIVNQPSPDAVASLFYVGAFAGFSFDECTSISLNETGNAIADYTGRSIVFTVNDEDIESNDEYVACATALLEARLSGVPSTIYLELEEGGGSASYEFYRFFEGLDGPIDDYDDHPWQDMYGGLGLGYRRV